MDGWLEHGDIIKHASGREGIPTNPAANGSMSSLNSFGTLHEIYGNRNGTALYIIHLMLNSKS